MTAPALVALGIAALCSWLSGARTAVYLAYACAYVPFITLDAAPGGLTGVGGFGGGNVRFKLAVRAACSAVLLACLARQRHAVQATLRVRHLPVLLLLAWSLAFVYRAQDPLVAAARLAELGVFFLSGIALYLESARHRSVNEVARWHACAIGVLPVLALLFVQWQPGLASHVDAAGLGRLGHKFLNANSLGFAAAILGLWSVSELRQAPARTHSPGLLSPRILPPRILPLGALLVAGSVVYASRSRTALAALIVGLAIVLWPARGLTYGKVALLTLGLACLASFQGALTQWMLRGEQAADLATGTGRTALWSALLREQVPEAPLGGAGYLMLSSDGGFEHAGRVWNNAHNTYVGALVAGGIPAFLCVLAIVIAPLLAAGKRAREARRTEDPALRAGWTLIHAFTAAVAVASITGFGVAGHPNPLMHFHYGLYGFVLAAGPIVAQGAQEAQAPPRAAAAAAGGSIQSSWGSAA